MSGPNISRQIAGLIGVTEDIVEAYDSIKNLSSLPEAFQEVNRRLPLLEQTLRDAESPAKKLKSTDDTQGLETVLHSCDEKANNMLEIFEKIGKKSKGQYDSSVYRAIVTKPGKHRVETLMAGILEDLGVLVAHNIFLAEMKRQVEPLAKALEELAEVSPSLADSNLADQPGAANQYGDNNRQYNLFGNGTQKIATGHYFEARGNQNFGTIPPEDSMKSNVA
ncbi:hypothetical protein PENARI_c112G10059 [Penicillium arizonense]|uniref:NACHT-NTPase and P-loop NTPases N-terminal domain-containing protein n=1 Tax=Penicillium arizonense TaxID=1835702 RepID=A0A1F5L1B1_PENAI|nr:hypothetical protein PENARI_c112G10059 [Penicillium arizonense]OGE46780.1 hypothetical protein PENARI_c112G10059 [Penicillium arizonense]